MARVPLILMGGSEDERLNPAAAAENVSVYEQHEYGSGQTLINCYFHPSAGGSGAIITTPGASISEAAVGAAVVRNLIHFPSNERLYCVSGNDVSYFSTGTETDVGDISTSTGRVRSAVNVPAGEIIIVDGTAGYIVDIGTGLAAISDSDYIDAADVCAQMDGYFIVADVNAANSRFYWSNLNDGTAWEATDFATKQTGGDPIQDLIVNGRELYVLGRETSEVWYNSGDPDQVFKRAPGGVVDYGVAGPHLAAVCAGRVMFPARSRRGQSQVIAMSGTSVEVISTPAVSNMLEKMNYRTDTYTFGYAFMENGHEFYAIAKPHITARGHPTIVYDATVGTWHLRAHYDDSSFPSAEIWTAAAYDTLGEVNTLSGAMAYGHRSTGDIYHTNVPANAGSDIENAGTGNNTDTVPRRIIGPMIRSDGPLRFREVLLELGNKAGTGSVTASEVELFVSKDGGNSWSSARTPRSYSTYAPGGGLYRWANMGLGKNWRFRLDISTDTEGWFIKGLWGTPVGDDQPRVSYG